MGSIISDDDEHWCKQQSCHQFTTAGSAAAIAFENEVNAGGCTLQRRKTIGCSRSGGRHNIGNLKQDAVRPPARGHHRLPRRALAAHTRLLAAGVPAGAAAVLSAVPATGALGIVAAAAAERAPGSGEQPRRDVGAHKLKALLPVAVVGGARLGGDHAAIAAVGLKPVQDAAASAVGAGRSIARAGRCRCRACLGGAAAGAIAAALARPRRHPVAEQNRCIQQRQTGLLRPLQRQRPLALKVEREQLPRPREKLHGSCQVGGLQLQLARAEGRQR